MSRPRARRLSSGPSRGRSGSLGPTPWWSRALPPDPPRRAIRAAAGPPPRLGEAERAEHHEAVLAETAATIQEAAGDLAVFEATGAGLERLGLNAHIATIEPAGGALVVRAIFLPWSGVAEVERVLRRAVVGARIDLESTSPYERVVTDRQAVREETPSWWARLAERHLDEDEAAAVGGLIRLRQAILAPIVAGHDILGVLTVWGGTLSAADLSTAELLGRIVGSALAASRPAGDRRHPLAA